ncbi:hypothetical protein [Sphingomonas sp.]|uniref:hypothetical protein n=1 Tax=Sphingomonas sp. TaxID=28214 RepID=UPI003B0002D8
MNLAEVAAAQEQMALWTKPRLDVVNEGLLTLIWRSAAVGLSFTKNADVPLSP